MVAIADALDAVQSARHTAASDRRIRVTEHPADVACVVPQAVSAM